MPPENRRLAAIDIGTNSIRGIVVEVDKGGKYRILDDEKATVRLGDGLATENRITGAAWQRAMDGIVRIKKIVDGYKVRAVDAVATSAVRTAGNGAEFVRAVKEKTGLKVEVITGVQEAELAALSARHNFDMDSSRYVMVDLGGGSAEIVTAFANHIEEIHSLDLGAVFLTEKFLKSDPVRKGELKKMLKYVKGEVKDAFGGRVITARCMIGSGGTMNSIAGMVKAARREAYGSLQGYEVLHSEIVHMLAMLLRKDIKSRRAQPGLNPERADIIIAGVALVGYLMETFNANVLRINERGIREGLILRSMRRHRMLPADERARDWKQSVIEFAKACHFDESHSRQVARLALEIMDSLASAFKLGEKDRQILEASALLHDTGYLISYASHHKHSFHLIRHADLFGFTPREREIIANVSRYHRGAMPKKKHESYAKLSAKDRKTVDMLGGILRLADGLDRRRNGIVQGLSCTLGKKTFSIVIEGIEDLSVELFGGSDKSDLFEAAFGRRIVFTAS